MGVMIIMLSAILFYSSIYLLIPLISAILILTLMQSSEILSLIINNTMLLDKLSLTMILLSLISSMLIVMSSLIPKEIAMPILLILTALMLTFMASSLFLFYIMFEIILIPTLFLITKSGSQPERLQAGMYLILHTVTASLPLLIGILLMKVHFNMMFSLNSCYEIGYTLMFILAFLVKMPMFIFHLWLPKAHVEAPLEGSMILAAVLLKLGGYGLIRMLPFLPKITNLSPWIVSISLIGAMSTSMNCIRQKDLKSLIAYSSVAHMGLILASLFTLSQVGTKGAIIMLVAHGLASSALFMLVNMVYTKFHTRNILSFKGMMKSFPNLTLWWFIFIAINISAPPSINLFSELFMLTSMMFWQPSTMMVLFFLSSFMTSIFSINLFINIVHNKPEINFMENSPPKFFLSLFMHFTPLILISTKLEIM